MPRPPRLSLELCRSYEAFLAHIPKEYVRVSVKIGFPNSQDGTAFIHFLCHTGRLNLSLEAIPKMARGWESKSVEAQQDEAASEVFSKKPRLTQEEAARRRQVDGLQLSLQRVRQRLDNTTDERRRHMLEHAAVDLENKIRDLGF
jgi:hypothetical protein